LVPLGITLTLAVILSLPFWLIQSRRPVASLAPTALEFQCTHCGAEYRSRPLICVHCGKENTIESMSGENSDTN
jgi:hypothetical protein